VNGIRPEPDQNLAINLNMSPGYVIDIASDPRDALADKHTLELRTIEGDCRNNSDKTVTTAPPATRPRRQEARAIPPFPDLVQTGIDQAGAPIFSYGSTNDRDET
jgi:hypothetical protein